SSDLRMSAASSVCACFHLSPARWTEAAWCCGQICNWGFLKDQQRSWLGRGLAPRLRRFSLSVAPRFLWECLTSRIVSWFPAPASSNPAGRFPALGFPVCFTSRVMWPMRAGWLSADGSDNSVLVKQSECVIEPLRTPPLPAESFAPSGAHQMPPNLLLHPELNVGKTPARVPYRKVAHPT